MSNETRPAQRGRAGQSRRPSGTGRTPNKKSGLDTTTMVFIALVAAVVAGSVFLVLNKQSVGETGAIQEFSPQVSVEGAALPVFNSETTTTINDSAIGQPVPAVSGQDFSGNDVSLPVDGESTVIAFLAHWCPHCQAELPLLLEEWIEGDLPDGVNVAAVPTGTRADAVNFPPSDWLLGRNDPWTESILLDSQDAQIAQSYGLASYPFFVVVGPDGDVLARTSGELGRDQLQSLIDVAAGAAEAGSIGDTGDQSNVDTEPESNE